MTRFLLFALALSPLAALAEPMPAARRAALVALITEAPQLLPEAETRAAEALAVPSLEETDYVDYYAGLDDPALTGAALDVAGAQALAAETGWGWLTLAEIALDMAQGDHDETGAATARPDAFAREALNAMAAGAAVNGLARAGDPGEAVSALALITRTLEAGGDGASAASVAHLARALYPDPESLAFDTDIAALLRLSEAPLMQPDPVPVQLPASSLHLGDWVLSCTPDRACVIESAPAVPGLTIARAAGPGAPVAISLRAGSTTAAPVAARLRIDARPLYPEASELALRRAPSFAQSLFRVPPIRLGAALDALLAGEKLTLSGGDGGEMFRADLSLYPLRALAAQIDRVQGREGTQTALVLRGLAPASNVPPAPMRRAADIAPRLDALIQEIAR